MSRSEGAGAIPTPDELAAIVAAVELCWPRPGPAAPAASSRPEAAWRWSGRWWGARHVAAERRRPWA